MSCTAIRELLGPYVDGELAPDEASATAGHLATCADCARDYEATLETVRRLRAGLVRYRAPDVLRARIRSAIREERQEAPPVRARRWRLPWRALAAGLVLAIASSGLTLLATGRPLGMPPAVADEVLAGHVRALMPDHLLDVSSNNQHNVKPWFNGRLDFSPAVPRLEDAGFPLLGGRLDYLRGRPVAAVVYGRGQHVIDVFSWPAEGERDAAPARLVSHGFHLLHWRQGGVEYWVVSDLNTTDLDRFATLLRGAGSSPARETPEPR